MKEHHDQKQTAEEWVYLAYASIGWQELKQGGNLEAGADAMEGCYLLAPHDLLSLLSYRT